MLFIIRGKKSDGTAFEVTRDGDDRHAAARSLKKEGATITSVMPLSDSMAHRVMSLQKLMKRVSLHEKVIFAENLAAMITAGLSLSRSLTVFERQTKNEYFRTVIAEIRLSIEKGSTLSESLAAYPSVFSRVFVSMVAAGEESGGLPGSLKNIGLQLGKSYALRKKVTGALMYPMIILFAMFCIGIFMMITVVPSLSASFAEFGAELPFATKVVIAVSDFLAAHTFVAIGGIAAFFFAAFVSLRTVRGRRLIDYVSLRFPGVSSLVRETNCATLARTLSSLVSAGVDLVEALTITARVVPNSYYADSLMEASLVVQRGQPISTVFNQHTRLYPVLLGAMAEVGEETGQLPDMLMNTAIFYEDEVDAATKNLSTIIEPVLMILIGVTVGFFAVSMIEPMYSITKSI